LTIQTDNQISRTKNRLNSLILIVAAIAMVLFLPTFTISAFAQNCQTVVPDWQWELDLKRAIEGFSYPLKTKSSTIYRLPVAFHIIRMSDGSGPPGPCPGAYPDTLQHPGVFRPAQIDSAMTDLNNMFVQVGLSFFQYGPIDYIDDDAYYCMTVSGLSLYDLSQVNSVHEAINIYIAPNTGLGGESLYWPGRQGILIDASQTGVPENPSTFAHEIGHYLGLIHTHEIRGFFPGPYTYECPDGSNCETEGDLLCDTPADPNLSGRMNLQCSYVLPAYPPPGCGQTPYNPQLNNMMSYATPICRDLFTPQQIGKMRYTLEYERPELDFHVSGVDDSLPKAFQLFQNIPNPFNPQTTISFKLQSPTTVSLSIFDISGKVVRTLVTAEELDSGHHSFVWNARDGAGRVAPAGVYFYRLDAGIISETRRMVLLK